MLARRLKLLAASVGALIFLLAVIIYLGSSRVDHDLNRSEIARQELETYLKLSEIVFRHFHLEADVLRGAEPDAEIGASRRELDQTIQRLKVIIKQESMFIKNDGGQAGEVDELERVAALERELYDAHREVNRIRQLFERGDELEGKRSLLALLKERVEGRINGAIAAAIEDEAAQVLEADREAHELLGRLILTAEITATVALAATLLLFILFTKRVGQPMTRLVEGLEQVASGNLSHRLAARGKHELADVASNFNAMVAELEKRDAELRSVHADLETKIEERTHELSAANSALQRIDQLRQRFLADISHELRTPITVIRGESEVALRGRNKDIQEYQRALQHINDSANQLSHLVSDLLFMARASAGHAYICRQAVELTGLLEAIREDAEVLGKDKDIKIAFRRVEGDATVLGDRQKLRQLFFILIENATCNSGSKVDIALDVTRSDSRVRTRVCDSGFGMSAADVDNAFDRFYRGNGTGRACSEGSGLGLLVAKSIVEAHSGEISIESAPGQGTTVTVDLPANQKVRSAA